MSSQFQNLIQKLKDQKRSPQDIKLIERAFDFAKKAHQGQKRLTGGDYIHHPIAVAKILAEQNLDPQTIAAALLHDVLENNKNISPTQLAKEFGDDIAFLVGGVSKLERLQYGEIVKQAKNLRKLFLATAEDLRTMLIKFADRLDNLETLEILPREKQKRIALETLEVYAPIAYRLGMGNIKGKLEDLAFPFVYPQEFKWLVENVKEKYEERQKYIEKLQPKILKKIQKEGLNPLNIHSRVKHYYSLWQKLKKYEMNFERMHDLIAIRIIVSDVEDCYKTLGILHKFWKPLPGRIKDYIALPKANGYRSLHTTVFCEGGRVTEFQIRTQNMHDDAEYGIASHWSYKENTAPAKDTKYSWIKQLQEWQRETAGSEELLESLRIDLFKDRIFAFTPRGDVIDLPEGATPVDFAYHIHTDIGERCHQSIINGQIAPLNNKLQSGDIVEIITKKNKEPSRDWLSFVKTNFAKTEIKKFLKKASQNENLETGTKLLNQELKILGEGTFANLPKQKKEKLTQVFNFNNLDDLIAAVGRGEISAQKITKAIFPEKGIQDKSPKEKKGEKISSGLPVMIGGQEGILVLLARCCNPLPGEKINAFLAKNQGARVHQILCPNLIRASKKHPERILPASWNKKNSSILLTSLFLETMDRVGLIQDISSTISNLGINMVKFEASSQKNSGDFKITIEIAGLDDLNYLISRLKEIDGVLEVERE